MAVSAVIYDHFGRLLVIQRALPPADGLWSVPGGRVEPGEGLADALMREIREETGLDIIVGPVVGVTRRHGYEIHNFDATLTDGHPVCGGDAVDLMWADRETLQGLDLVPLLWEFLENHHRLPRS